MLSLLFVILLFIIFGKIIGLAIRATWGITKILFSIVFLPILLIALVLGGLIYLAFPILIIVGLVSLFSSRA